MGAVVPDETSRYRLGTEDELSDGSLVWNPPPAVGPLDLYDDIVHIVTSGETLFTLAMRYFVRLRRPEQYYWAIADYQSPPIGDPLEPLEAGKRLKIPSVRTLQEIILNQDRLEVDPIMLVATLER